jgi:hypothetical protein
MSAPQRPQPSAFYPRSRRRHVEEPQKSQFVGQLLSLFIMLVAFFIVLNSISIYDKDKSKPAMESLGTQFATQQQAPLVGNEESAGDVAGNPGAQGEGNSFDTEVTGLFSSVIPAMEASTRRERGALYLHMTADEFEEALGRDRTGPFNKALAATIRNRAQGISYHMDVTFNLGLSPARVAAGAPQETAALATRFAAIASRLETAGLPPSQFSVGAARGDKDTVDIIFRPAEKLDPMSGGLLQEGK